MKRSTRRGIRGIARATAALAGLIVILALPAPAGAAPSVTSEQVAASQHAMLGGGFGGVADAVSEDGRYVAFVEPAPENIEETQVWLRDTVADTTTLVSKEVDGLRARGIAPAISPDGRWVAYGGCAPPPGQPSSGNICLWDRQSGSVEIVSRMSDGTPFGAHPWTAGVSADGRYVSFISSTDVYVRDRAAGETTTVNRNQQGQHFIAVWESGAATSISDDGDVVVFEGYDANASGGFGVIVSKRSTGALTFIPGDGLAGKNSQVSGNGRFVVYRDNEDINPPPVHVYDLSDGTSERVGDASGGAGISDDGRYVTAYDSDLGDLYRYDRETDTRVRVAVDTSGNNVYSAQHAISGDGSAVAFEAISDTDQLGVLLARVEDDPGDGIIRPTLDPQAPPKDAVWGWGYNSFGQLGIGSSSDRLLPSEIGGLSNVDALAAGGGHSLALKSDGTVWAWGADGQGQLGNDSAFTNRPTPVGPVLTGVKAVAAGGSHSLALKSDGTVWAWGDNNNLQLGNNSRQDSPTPVGPVLTGVKAVAAGDSHSLALKSDGTVWAWGYNGCGQLGDNSFQERPTPVGPVLTGVKAVAAGGCHSLALKSDGTVWAWGADGQGQLGNDSALGPSRTTPVGPVLTGVDALDAGAFHSLALKPDGTVWAWGWDGVGQLGNDSALADRPTPVGPVLTGVKAVAAGSYHSLALKSDGTLRGWGYGGWGQLGDGATVQRNTPVAVSGLTDAVAIAAGGHHSLAVGRASPTQGVESFTQALPAGATVTTDVEQDGATPADPLETTLTTPVAGTVSVAETPSVFSGADFSVHGRSVEITAPAASAANPLVIRFRLDASVYPADWPASSLYVSRNGATVGNCSGPGASPDPCVESRTRLPDGDVELVVRTSAASNWTIGRAGPAANAGGPYTVAEGSKITLNGSATGGEAPLAYRWLGAAGELNDPGKARPTFTGNDDATLTLNLLVTDAADLAGTDDTTVTVTNRPPVVSPLAVDTNTNRRLAVAAVFADPGRLDTHTALIRWGDGTQSPARVIERHGSGAAGADHQYARKGTYTVRLTVRDDDGGEGSVERRIEIR